MRYKRQNRPFKKVIETHFQPFTSGTKQPYDAFLVLDVEATCHEGTDFNFPNEIIEFPVCLMRWRDRSVDTTATHLEIVDEFRSFVKPSWQPVLSKFCTNLTGITQEQVNAAPSFPEVLYSFRKFLVKNRLIDGVTGQRLVRFCWCSDGPFDLRDFVVKQCFISNVRMPDWMQGDILDVRTLVFDFLYAQDPVNYMVTARTWTGKGCRTLNIPAQLLVLGLPGFEGRQHSGIDDTRNIARIIAELARRGITLFPNTAVYPDRRWHWMDRWGQMLQDYSPSPLSPSAAILPAPILAN